MATIGQSRFGLNADKQYRLEDVNTIVRSSDRKTYIINCVFTEENNGKTIILNKTTNVQYADKAIIYALNKGLDQSYSNELETFNLPNEVFQNKPKFLKDTGYVDKDFFIRGIYDYDLDEANPQEKLYSSNICVYELNEPIWLGEKLVYFIYFNSFEIFRYFLTGFEAYNECLLSSDFERTNKIFNPKKSICIEDENGEKSHYLVLRKKITNRCQIIAGDLAFLPGFKSQAKVVIGLLQAGEKDVFARMQIPIKEFSEFSVMGRFVTDKSGFTGFSCKIIRKANYSRPLYLLLRENDGRTTSKRTSLLPQIFGGKKKKKQKPNPEKDKTPDFDPKLTSDKELENINITQLQATEILSLDLPERGIDEYIQLEKIDQNYRAGKKIPNEDTTSNKGGAISENGDSGTGVVGVTDETTPVDEKYISEKLYWSKFSEIIAIIATNLKHKDVKALYLNTEKNIEFVKDVITGNFSKIKIKKLPNDDFYLVEFSIGSKFCYVIEIEIEKHGRSTLLFYNDSADENKKFMQLIVNDILEILVMYDKANGLISKMDKTQIKKYNLVGVNFHHQYYSRSTKENLEDEIPVYKRLKTEVAIENQANKITRKIKALFEITDE